MLVTTRGTQIVARNRTIDDGFGDSVSGIKPIFLPTTVGVWGDERCTECQVQPDKAMAFNGTWTAATFEPKAGRSGPISIDLSFTGTAIYVYFITGNQIAGGKFATRTECNFMLDEDDTDSFLHIPDNTTTDMQYNVLAFSRMNLENVNHTLRVSNRDVDYNVLVIFDYAIYTIEDILVTPTISGSTPSFGPFTDQPQGPNVPTMIAVVGALAGIIGILIIILSTILIRRRCRKRGARQRASLTQELPGADQEPKMVGQANDSSDGFAASPQHSTTDYRPSISDAQSRPNSLQSASRQSSIYSLSILLTSDDEQFSNPGNLSRVSMLSTTAPDRLQSEISTVTPAQNTHDRGSLPMTSYTDSMYPVSTLPSYPGTAWSISPPPYSDLSGAQSWRLLNVNPFEETYAGSLPELPDLVHV